MGKHYVVSCGGGLTSTMFLPQMMIEQHGKENVTLVMARLPNEDPDVWRLCDAIENEYGVAINYIGLGLTPWDIFFKNRMIGNTRADICSRVLKREVLLKYMRENHDPANTVLCLGITRNEIDRMVAVTANWLRNGWEVAAPLAEVGFFNRDEQMVECERRYGFVPRLYKYGFSHNNCGGACIKAGHREWARLLWYLPDVYEWWETNEEKFQQDVGQYTILRDRRVATGTTTLSLKKFRERCRRWWAGCLPLLDFDLLPRVRDLDPTPACQYCEAA